jgi:hypothetical protein
MTSAFIIQIALNGDENKAAVAEQIMELVSDEFNVTSVHPWSSPGASPEPEPLGPLDAASPY